MTGSDRHPAQAAEGRLRLLLVEDDLGIAKPMLRFLERQQFLVSHCTRGREAVEVARTWLPHLVLLDLSLPDVDGIAVAGELRGASDVPIIIVTARGAEQDRIAGLDGGADDYLVKPFGTGELLARINAVLRRTGRMATAAGGAARGPFTLDDASKSARLDGRDLGLTPKEYEILRILINRSGSLVRREELARAVWNAPLHEVAKSMDVHLVWLRRKLGEDAADPRYLRTVRGAGVGIWLPDTGSGETSP